MAIHQEMADEAERTKDLEDLFEKIDVDASGYIDVDEFENMLRDERVKAHFWSLGLQVSQARELFRLLDVDGSQMVSVSEFISGCLRLTGEARSIDLATLLHENRHMMIKWDRFALQVK